MARAIVVCAALLTVPLVYGAGEPAEVTETVIRLTVPPKEAPKPALKYQLLPEMTEMQQGNPIQAYLRCFSEQQNFFYNREAVKKREEYEKMALESLPVKELQGYGRLALDQADYAARLTTPDWQILYKMRKEGARMLLPDIQGMRDLTRALKVRFRVALAEKKFDVALRTAKTMFAMARHLGKHPTLIANLVGMAIANETMLTVEEMLQQPGCPNLYWAFTELPSPLVEIRHGIRGERVLGAAELSRLIDRRPMSAEELEGAVKAISELYRVTNLQYALSDGKSRIPANEKAKEKQTPREWLKATADDPAHVREARSRLVQRGLSKKVVESFPPLQVIFLDEKREYEDRFDEQTKGMLLPYWQGEAYLARHRRKNEECLFRMLAPSCTRIRNFQARLDQRIALLRTVEALRLHAAAHGGKLPEKLADVAVPLPVDPISGKAFRYTRAGNKATLKGTTPVGQERNPQFNVRYEVTIKS
jgi:hypothetical protein